MSDPENKPAADSQEEPGKTGGTPPMPLSKALVIRITKMFAYGFVGAAIMLFAVAILFLNDKPDLSVWHTADLDEEYTTRNSVDTFEEYLELEDRLFEQLETEVYQKLSEAEKHPYNRYHRESRSNSSRWPTDWNRSYELKHESPKAGVLLLHGLTDSPYSLHHLGERLHQSGAHVLALRIPGHGTAPAALARTEWEDMAGAVELAMRHLSKAVGDRPVHIVGYSNGAALALHYVLESIEDPELPPVSAMAMLSPEIGVTKMAAIAVWQQRMGKVLGLEKLKWQTTNLEYDPFKYVSFPVSAGRLTHELTGVNRKQILRLAADKKLDQFPPLIAFQSAVDATVTAPSLVSDLYTHLPPDRHNLVVFDVDRSQHVEPFLKRDPAKDVGLVLDNPDRGFVFTLLTNKDPESQDLVTRVWKPKSKTYSQEPTPFTWPEGVYSLSHVALPFPQGDSLYGKQPTPDSPRIQIGSKVLRGEKGSLRISANDMLRLRWNPFYPFLEQKLIVHLGLR